MASRSFVSRLVAPLALAVALLSSTSVADAQMDPAVGEQVRGTPKGTIGLGLVGAELGLIIPVAAGLDDTWALIVFPVVGATGGALGGYFGFDRQDGRTFRGLSIGSLVLGMAMVIPTIVITVSKTRYGEDDLNDDREEAAEEREEAARIRDAMAAGPGLLRYTGGRLRLSMPGVSVSPLAASPELVGARGTHVSFTLLSGAF